MATKALRLSDIYIDTSCVNCASAPDLAGIMGLEGPHAKRWARRHAERTGHTVHVTFEEEYVYSRADPSPALTKGGQG